jgi:hypothetical protein
LDYLRLNHQNKLKNIFLVHGEEDMAMPFREKLLQKGYKNVQFSASGEIINI